MQQSQVAVQFLQLVTITIIVAASSSSIIRTSGLPVSSSDRMPVRAVDDQSVISMMYQCPIMFPRHVVAMCYTETSCEDFCGSGQWLQRKKTPDRKYCSCDVTCLVYRDCCDDFLDRCPEEASKLGEGGGDGEGEGQSDDSGNGLMQLMALDLKCVPVNEDLSVAVIASCPASSSSDLHVVDSEVVDDVTSSSPTDSADEALSRKIVVTDFTSAFSYINEDVYRCNHPTGKKNATFSSLLKWNKEYRSKDVEMNKADLEQFLSNGTSSRRFESRLYDVPPPHAGVKVRICGQSLKSKVRCDLRHWYTGSDYNDAGNSLVCDRDGVESLRSQCLQVLASYHGGGGDVSVSTSTTTVVYGSSSASTTTDADGGSVGDRVRSNNNSKDNTDQPACTVLTGNNLLDISRAKNFYRFRALMMLGQKTKVAISRMDRFTCSTTSSPTPTSSSGVVGGQNVDLDQKCKLVYSCDLQAVFVPSQGRCVKPRAVLVVVRYSRAASLWLDTVGDKMAAYIRSRDSVLGSQVFHHVGVHVDNVPTSHIYMGAPALEDVGQGPSLNNYVEVIENMFQNIESAPFWEKNVTICYKVNEELEEEDKEKEEEEEELNVNVSSEFAHFADLGLESTFEMCESKVINTLNDEEKQSALTDRTGMEAVTSTWHLVEEFVEELSERSDKGLSGAIIIDSSLATGNTNSFESSSTETLKPRLMVVTAVVLHLFMCFF